MAESFPDFDQPAYRAFEAYGYAMAWASVFEIFLRLVLIEKKVPGFENVADPERREIEKAKYGRRIFRAGFGKLVQWVIDQRNLSAGLQIDLRNAKDVRDHLAHFFWQAHLGHLVTEKGIDLIAAECNLHGQFFNEAATRLRQETGVDIDTFKRFVEEFSAELFHENPLASVVS